MKTLTAGEFKLLKKAINIACANAVLLVRGCCCLGYMVLTMKTCGKLVDLKNRFSTCEGEDGVDISDSDIEAVHEVYEAFNRLNEEVDVPNGISTPLHEAYLLLTVPGYSRGWYCMIDKMEVPAV